MGMTDRGAIMLLASNARLGYPFRFVAPTPCSRLPISALARNNGRLARA